MWTCRPGVDVGPGQLKTRARRPGRRAMPRRRSSQCSDTHSVALDAHEFFSSQRGHGRGRRGAGDALERPRRLEGAGAGLCVVGKQAVRASVRQASRNGRGRERETGCSNGTLNVVLHPWCLKDLSVS